MKLLLKVGSIGNGSRNRNQPAMNRKRSVILRALPLFLLLGIGFAGSLSCQAADERIVRGRVIEDANGNGRLDSDEQGMPGIVISDGVQFVKTGKDGSYELKVAPDPMIPYRPAQVIAMSWPSGSWPSVPWYRRLADLPEGEALNFALRAEEQELPLTLAHGTDPHDNCASGKSLMWAEEIGRMKKQVSFAVMTGDLGYAGTENAHKMFASVAEYTRKFPVPLFHTVGNHDVVGIHSADWKKPTEIHGNGAYTKFLGPIRWSFNRAGVHFVGIDWALIDPKNGEAEVGVPDVATDWLRKDLELQKPGTRTFLFLHQPWSPTNAFWDVLVNHKVELVLGGHSHRNLDMSQRGIKALTTMNLRGPYRLLTIFKDRHELIERCMGCKDPTYHSRKCRLKSPDLNTAQRRQKHLKLPGVQLASGEKLLEQFAGDAMEIVAEIVPGRAKRCGLKLAPSKNPNDVVEIAIVGKSLFVDGLEIPAVPLPHDKGFDLRVIVTGNRFLLTSNLRVLYEKRLHAQGPRQVTLFAEDGDAQFNGIEAWRLK